MARTIAVFDFDNTLIKGDSFFPFLCYAAGYPHALIALADTVLLYAVRFWNNRHDPLIKDYRTFFKAELIKRLLNGQTIGDLQPAIGKIVGWTHWIEPMKEKLLEHYRDGHHIVIASGGLDLYLHEILKDMPVDALICTTVGVENGKTAGTMTSGNCVRERKADMVMAYIKQHGPFDDSWGYGNYPHDVPMLNLVKHRIIV